MPVTVAPDRFALKRWREIEYTFVVPVHQVRDGKLLVADLEFVAHFVLLVVGLDM